MAKYSDKKWYFKTPENQEFNSYCDKKSFYKKAYIIRDTWVKSGDNIELYSYDNFICAYDADAKKLTFTNTFKAFIRDNDGISKTTLRHLKCFIKYVADKYKNPFLTYENITANKKRQTTSSYFLHLRGFSNQDPYCPVFTVD